MLNDYFDDTSNNEFDSALSDSYVNSDNVSSFQLYSEEMGDSSSSGSDYSSYFDDIINRLETLISYDSSDGSAITLDDISNSFEALIAYDSSDDSAVTLDTIHHDLGIIITLLLVFIAVFVGHGFVSKFRNL